MAAALVCGLALFGQATGAAAQAAGDLEAQFAGRVTAERRAVGLGALPTEDDLVVIARQHSAAMAASNRVYHNTELALQVQGWQLVAENVGTGSTVDQIHGALMASPPHRADIVDARFTGIGIGVVQSGGTLWVTQVFRRSTSGTVPASGTTATGPPAPETLPAPAPAPPPPAGPAGAEPSARAAEPRAARRARPPAAVTTTTTTTTAPATATTAPPATVQTPPVVGAAAVDLNGVPASSASVPTRSGLVAAGLVATALLWAAAAGTLKVTLRHRVGWSRS